MGIGGSRCTYEDFSLMSVCLHIAMAAVIGLYRSCQIVGDGQTVSRLETL